MLVNFCYRNVSLHLDTFLPHLQYAELECFTDSFNELSVGGNGGRKLGAGAFGSVSILYWLGVCVHEHVCVCVCVLQLKHSIKCITLLWILSTSYASCCKLCSITQLSDQRPARLCYVARNHFHKLFKYIYLNNLWKWLWAT